MASVFLSYSSHDEAFALELFEGLKLAHEPWIDSRHIPAGAPFRREVDAAIEAAEVVIVVLSHRWLDSEECRAELQRALELNKRVIPVEPERLGGVARPAGLEGLSPIGFWRRAGVDDAWAKLNEELLVDHAWLRAHRDLLIDSLRWQRSDAQDTRLRGEALRNAVRMVERAATGGVTPDLVEVQREYVRACEAAEAAEIERLTRLNRRISARHLLSEALRVRSMSAPDLRLALRLSVESLRRSPGGGARTLANELLARVPKPRAELAGTEGAEQLRASKHRVAFARGKRVQVWDEWRARYVLDRELAEAVRALRFDGNTIVVLPSLRGLQRRQHAHPL